MKHFSPMIPLLGSQLYKMSMTHSITNGTWILQDLSPKHKVVGSKWVYKLKLDIDGLVACYKARLVANGFTQKARLDYKVTFSPIVKFDSI